MPRVAALLLAIVWGASTAAALMPTGPRIVAGPDAAISPSEAIQGVATVVSILSTIAGLAYTVLQVRQMHRAERAALRPSIDRPDIPAAPAPPRDVPVTAAAWGKFLTWAALYPALIGLFDVWLFREGGYDATITGVTRSIFHRCPLVALPVGIVVVGLYLHFFHAFPAAAANRPALNFFWLGGLVALYAMFARPLYG